MRFFGLMKQAAMTACVAATGIFAAEAAEISTIKDTRSEVRLISETTSLKPGESQWLMLEVAPNKDWHSYWINHGDSGAAPTIEWNSQQGASFKEPLFPTPHRLPVGPLMNYGYKGTARLLVEMNVPADFAGSSFPLKADLEWLVCNIECVPQGGTIDANIPVGDGAIDTSVSAKFTEARAALPNPAFWSADLSVAEGASTLTVYMDSEEQAAVNEAYFFPASDGVTDYAQPQKLAKSETGLTLTLPRYPGALDPENGEGVLVLTQADGSEVAVNLEAELKAGAAPAAFAPTEGEQLPLWQAAIFALIGGMILNLMPCVFPVLSLKALSLARSHSSGDMKHMRAEGWAYTAGILSSFALIVIALLVLRAGGAAIGWGFQLQEPAVVIGLIVVMFTVGLSLSGFFEIRLGVEGAGQNLTASEGLKGPFFTGVLATLVATPCTAPFMAPAIGYALTQPIYVIFVVFFMLAFGLALPFLALSYSPKLAGMMPRPGPWMETFKELMAFPMYAAVLWLFTVYVSLTDAQPITLVMGGLLLLTFAIWLFKKQQKIAKVSALASAGLALFLLFAPAAPKPTEGPFVNPVVYSETNLADLRAEGKPVFAYFTAEWCITCKVNERTALYRDETEQLFKDQGITVIKGDWTNRNKEIADLLAQFGRAGVPLYIYYPADGSEPKLLPEVLTPSVIKDYVTS